MTTFKHLTRYFTIGFIAGFMFTCSDDYNFYKIPKTKTIPRSAPSTLPKGPPDHNRLGYAAPGNAAKVHFN